MGEPKAGQVDETQTATSIFLMYRSKKPSHQNLKGRDQITRNGAEPHGIFRAGDFALSVYESWSKIQLKQLIVGNGKRYFLANKQETNRVDFSQRKRLYTI